MKHGLITIHFQHYWHCGSGQAGEGDVDLLPVTEPCGLPYVPGRALRGRLKWAAREAGWDAGRIERVFGKGNAPTIDEEGRLRFTSAVMRDQFAVDCRKHHAEHSTLKSEVSALFEDIASTKLASGVAEDKNLRRVRYVVPVSVIAEVEALDEDAWKALETLVPNLRAIGKGKHDGFGWCRAALKDHRSKVRPAQPGDASAYEVDIELLDDVVLSATSATTEHATLDHIPGSALMGAAARRLFQTLGETDGALALALDQISFGNGVPVAASGHATVPMPFSLHHKKDKPGSEHGKLLPDKISNLGRKTYEESLLKGAQPVQMRGDWLDATTGHMLKVARTQTLKTAIDTNPAKYETAAKAELFGYEGIAAGARFRSRILLDAFASNYSSLCQVVRETFDGCTIRLGRSKGAEFGRARCTLVSAADPATGANPAVGSEPGRLLLLAESDLALVDANGLPSLRPEPEFFGLDGWKLDEERTHLRFRRYSLWNAKRGAPDLDRQVISKGSVIVFTGGATTDKLKTRVGIGQAEGLGRVKPEPAFLAEETPSFSGNGMGGRPFTTTAETMVILDTDNLMDWVAERYEEKRFDIVVNDLAQKWCASWRGARGKVSASQWGRLEEVARDAGSLGELKRQLGAGTKDRPGQKTIFGHAKWVKEDQKKLVAAILASLGESSTHGDRLTLAAFRAASRRMAADIRRDRP